MKTYTIQEVVQQLETWTRYELPTLNHDIEGKDQADVLLARFKPLCDTVASIVDRVTDPHVASKLIQLLSFGVSSIERHLQWSQRQPGAGVELLGVADTLLTLADRAQQPPRDTYRTYWLDNADSAPLTFTGSYQEVLFNRVVNDTQERHASSADALQLICSGAISLHSDDAVDAIERAILHQERLTGEFKSLMQPSTDRPNEWAMTRQFFAISMRTYLCKYSIGGTEWTGPNAANIPGQALCDFAIGTIDGEYRRTIRNRFPLLHVNDRMMLERAMDQPSLLDRILGEINVEAWELGGIADGDLVPRFVARRDLMPALIAFTELVKAAANLSATHFALIHNYLVRTTDEVDPAVRDRLPVGLNHGTGDMSHDGTWRIMQMRKNHPIAKRVVTAIRAAA